MSRPSVHHPDNFNFARGLSDNGLAFARRGSSSSLWPEVRRHAGDVYHLRLNAGEGSWPWEDSPLASAVQPAEPGERLPPSCLFDPSGTLHLWFGPHELRARVGVCGASWIFDFEPDEALLFYGMGEKWGPLEKSGTRTRFWNRDVWAEVPRCAVERGDADPVYASIPYLIVRKGNAYVGILVDNPYAVYMATQAYFAFHAPTEAQTPAFFFGSDQGTPSVYFIVGPSLRELTEKLQRLVGVTPRPPLWALGHHQCRWGYRSVLDLERLAHKFEEHQIPNDGLWLDIDYMDAFKVFTLHGEHFPEPERALGDLTARGFHVVPIVDPGVKVDPSYAIYHEGVAQGHFCQTAEGLPFTGYAWPGRAHFPDFSQAHTRQWWAGHVATLFERGFSGFWLDMNDPAVGGVEVDAMRFGQGNYSHASVHNLYGLGMCQASHSGLLKARPDERPFLLTRSASTGVARWAAVWSGDNCSNAAFLSQSIPTTLNLALSGVPFNGPDVPGFGGDADAELIVCWYKAAFLFPFLRNHSCHDTRPQEPWAFDKNTTRRVRRFIRLRYKLLPYLYGLYIEQERHGAAVLRPLMYASDDPEHARTEDAFFVGPQLLQAPCLAGKSRDLKLPSGSWFDASRGGFVPGGQRLRLHNKPGSTPLFIRDGSLVPMQVGTRTDQKNALNDIELHAFLSAGTAFLVYEFDDGVSFAYQQGVVSRVRIELTLGADGPVLEAHALELGCGPLRLRLVLHGAGPGALPAAPTLLCRLAAGEQALPLTEDAIKLTGRRLQVWVSEAVLVS